MDPRLQGNRPAPRSHSAERQAQNNAAAQQNHNVSAASERYAVNNAKRTVTKKSVILAVVALAVIAGGVFAWKKFAPIPGIDSSKYQAVFLANDQVYFGKVTSISDDVIVIKDIYYLQKQASQSSTAQQGTNPTQQSNMSLAKLGDELHAPEDTMNINRDQVLFWENLKPNGKVTEAIKQYKK